MTVFEKQWQSTSSYSDKMCPFTETEKRCVVLAGLMHDVGHGIHSHLFDRSVVKGILETYHKDNESELSLNLSDWEHEDASSMMIKHAYKELKETDDETLKLITENEIELICALVKGNVDHV
jgi:HD superfamily phosphohydrolase